MTPIFEKKVLEAPKRVCLRLREARLANDMTIDELAFRTKIDRKYLEALEECRYESIPYSTTYKKTFIKKYAAMLAMDGAELAKQFIDEEGRQEKKEEKKSTNSMGSDRFFNAPIVLRTLLIVSIVVIGFSLLALQVKRMVDPPALSLGFPYEGFTTTEQTIRLDGHVEEGAELLINGQTVVTGEAGAFSTPLTLAPGTNTIILSAEKKHGKTTTVTRHVILRSTPSTAAKESTLEEGAVNSEESS